MTLFTEQHKKRFSQDGYCIIENIIPNDLRLRIKKIIESLAIHEKVNNNADFYDGTKNTQRIWNLLNKHSLFSEIILWPVIMDTMDYIFDRQTPHFKYFLSSFQANILYAGAQAQKIHIDTPFPEPLPQWPVKANTIWLIDDFTDSNGSTEVVPGSHLTLRKPSPHDIDKLIKVIAPAGSLVITHGALWHRSGPNLSSQSRTVLLGSFAASYAREISAEEDYIKVLDKNFWLNSSSQLKKILGYGHGIKVNSLSGSSFKIKKF